MPDLGRIFAPGDIPPEDTERGEGAMRVFLLAVAISMGVTAWGVYKLVSLFF